MRWETSTGARCSRTWGSTRAGSPQTRSSAARRISGRTEGAHRASSSPTRRSGRSDSRWPPHTRPACASGTSTSRRAATRRLVRRPRSGGNRPYRRRRGAARHRRRHDHGRRGRRGPARGDDRGRRRGAARRPLARGSVLPHPKRVVAEAARGVRPVNRHQLAQVNVARLLAPIDAPEIADFVAALDPVNARADRARGFIWRLQTEDGNATRSALRRPARDREPLGLGLDRGARGVRLRDEGHRAVLRRRREWFERHVESDTALWWIRAGTTPTVDEAVTRLAHLREHGPTPWAFTFRERFAASRAAEPDPGPPTFDSGVAN